MYVVHILCLKHLPLNIFMAFNLHTIDNITPEQMWLP